MADDAVTVRDINWREAFPFTHLFRAFRVAVHPSKLILALLAIACLWCGGLVLDAIWLRSYQVTPSEIAGLELRQSPDRLEQLMGRELLSREGKSLIRQERAEGESYFPIFRTFFEYEVTQANNVLMFRGSPFESVWRFIAVGPMWLWTDHWLFALIFTAWFLLIWSVFGGAIARIAAVHVARDEKTSVRHALAFSVSKVLSFIFAPVIPVLIVLGIGLIIAISSWVLLHIPWIGPILVGLLFFLALLGGFVITLVILGTIGGFNLMYPTVAVEGSDSFDAISRSFSYVFARPWRMLWYTAVAVVYGAICYLFVRFFVWMILAVTWFFMSWFLGGHHLPPNDVHPADVWPRMWPPPTLTPLDPLAYTPDYQTLKGTEAAAAGLILWWNYLLIGLVGAFVISFYFSANTIIYYLMRREVDATEMDDVYVEESDDELEEPAASAGAAAPTPAAAAAEGTTVVTESTTVRVYPTPQPGAGGGAEPPAASGPTPPAPGV